jgi:nucleoside-diphosphate-sugar epimerase
VGTRVFVAGATGAIGRPLMQQLRAAGHTAIGMTRSGEKAEALRADGFEAVVLDVFDADRLRAAVIDAQPGVVIHQLTDLPPNLDPRHMADAVVRNARIRREGTANLVAAAESAGVPRLVAQSIAWVYAPGPLPHREDDPLDTTATGGRAISIGGVVALEQKVLGAALEGIVLRYGHLYGPGTGLETAPPSLPLHVDAAAHAALLAVDHGRRGIYNVVENGAEASIDKAISELGLILGNARGEPAPDVVIPN